MTKHDLNSKEWDAKIAQNSRKKYLKNTLKKVSSTLIVLGVGLMLVSPQFSDHNAIVDRWAEEYVDMFATAIIIEDSSIYWELEDRF